MELANQDESESMLVASSGPDDSESVESNIHDASQSVGRADPRAPNASESQDTSTRSKGEQKMTGRKAAAAALTAAFAASAPLAAANGDEYQFIAPASYPAENPSYPAVSDAIALETGAMRTAGMAGELEARSRSSGFSSAIALNAMKFRIFIITIR